MICQKCKKEVDSLILVDYAVDGICSECYKGIDPVFATIFAILMLSAEILIGLLY